MSSKKNQTDKRMINGYYKRNLDKFIEDELGVKLLLWQRMFLRAVSKWGLKDNDQ